MEPQYRRAQSDFYSISDGVILDRRLLKEASDACKGGPLSYEAAKQLWKDTGADLPVNEVDCRTLQHIIESSEYPKDPLALVYLKEAWKVAKADVRKEERSQKKPSPEKRSSAKKPSAKKPSSKKKAAGRQAEENPLQELERLEAELAAANTAAKVERLTKRIQRLSPPKGDTPATAPGSSVSRVLFPEVAPAADEGEPAAARAPLRKRPAAAVAEAPLKRPAAAVAKPPAAKAPAAKAPAAKVPLKRPAAKPMAAMAKAGKLARGVVKKRPAAR